MKKEDKGMKELEELGIEVVQADDWETFELTEELAKKNREPEKKEILKDFSKNVEKLEKVNSKLEDATKENDLIKSSNNTLRTIVIILLLTVIVLSCLLVILLVKGNQDIKTPEMEIITDSSNKINKDVEDLIEKEVTDVNVKNDLAKKVDLLLYSNINSDNSESKIFDSYGFRNALLKRDLTGDEKQNILLLSLKFKDLNGSNWESVSEVKSAIDNELSHSNVNKEQLLGEYGVLDYNYVNEQYKNFFGEELNNPTQTLGRCPKFIYSASTKEFYRFPPRCGGSAPGFFVTYKSKYFMTEDEIDVYVNVGYIMAEGYSSTGYEVFSDFELTNQELTGSFNPINSIEKNANGAGSEFRITSENADKFSEYRFRFKKDNNNNYYFIGVDQVK